MIKEPKHIDVYTSGRQLSNEDFSLISQWIATNKQKQSTGRAKRKSLNRLPHHENTQDSQS